MLVVSSLNSRDSTFDVSTVRRNIKEKEPGDRRIKKIFRRVKISMEKDSSEILEKNVLSDYNEERWFRIYPMGSRDKFTIVLRSFHLFFYLFFFWLKKKRKQEKKDKEGKKEKKKTES